MKINRFYGFLNMIRVVFDRGMIIGIFGLVLIGGIVTLNVVQATTQLDIPSDNGVAYNNLNWSASAADPFLTKENDTYYVFATGGRGCAPEYYTSSDLKSWSVGRGVVFKNKNGMNIDLCKVTATMYGGASYDANMTWAPEVYMYNNTYYMVFTIYNDIIQEINGNRAKYLHVAYTRSLAEGFTYIGKIDTRLGQIDGFQEDFTDAVLDGHIFFDDVDEDNDGVNDMYLYFKAEQDQNIYGVKIADLNTNTGVEIDSNPRLLLEHKDNTWEQVNSETAIVEAPFMTKWKEKYYLMYSGGDYKEQYIGANCPTNGRCPYAAGYTISDGGPLNYDSFKNHDRSTPFLYGTVSDGTYDYNHLYSTGHNMIYEAGDEELYTVYGSSIKPGGDNEPVRKMNYDRIGITDDGILFVNGPSVKSQPLPSGTKIGGNTYYHLASNNFNISGSGINNETDALTDVVNNRSQTRRLDRETLLSIKTVSTDDLTITLNNYMDVSDVWIYGAKYNDKLNGASYTVTINDAYTLPSQVISDDYAKIQIPMLSEHIKKITLNFNKNVTLSEVEVVTKGSDSYSGPKYLSQVMNPSAITGLANGTIKTAAAFELPSTVQIVYYDGDMMGSRTASAAVSWDVDGSEYDADSLEKQTFTIAGTIILPNEITNPNNISLTTSIDVTVDAAGNVDMPTASIAAGVYAASQNVALSTSTDGAIIYYTTDGSAPTINSNKYTEAIMISGTKGQNKVTTIKAIAVKSGLHDSDVASFMYVISIPDNDVDVDVNNSVNGDTNNDVNGDVNIRIDNNEDGFGINDDVIPVPNTGVGDIIPGGKVNGLWPIPIVFAVLFVFVLVVIRTTSCRRKRVISKMFKKNG